MNVAELIAALQKMPQDAKVIMVKDQHFSDKWSPEVRDVIYNDPKYVNDEAAGTVELDNWPAENY